MAAPKPTTPESRRVQAQLAVAVRDHGPDDPRTVALRQVWEAERYIAGLAAAAADAPTVFTDDQRGRLAEVVAAIPITQEHATP